MTKTTTNLIGILLTILTGTYMYFMLCSSCRTTSIEKPRMEMAEPIAPQATSYPFAFSDGQYAYNENDNYNFEVSSPTIQLPIAQKVTEGVTSLTTFLIENTEKVVTISGYYKSNEDNTSAYPNLGLARANAVKNHFVANGIPSVQINTTATLMNEMVPNNNRYMGPISYGIAVQDSTTKDKLAILYEAIKADPLVLYFETAQTSINLTAEQRQKIADISRYLDKVEGAKAIIVGHTDNTGEAVTNMKLGQNRADFAKAYLMKNGIAASKINATSKGQTEPLVSNATEEGQAKNRRTSITLN